MPINNYDYTVIITCIHVHVQCIYVLYFYRTFHLLDH